AVNGWWIGRLIRRADTLAARASRWMGCTVSLVSLRVAALGLTAQVSPHLDRRADDKAILFGTLTVAVVALGYALARLLEATGSDIAPGPPTGEPSLAIATHNGMRSPRVLDSSNNPRESTT